MTTFGSALSLILELEGGYVNNPNDRGGATNFGITQSVYDSYRHKAVKEITNEEVADIYNRNYWHDGRCDTFDDVRPRLSTVHFDGCVNCGTFQAAKFLQRALLVKDDGMIGKITIAAARICNESEVILSILEQRKMFYMLLVERNPSQAEFLSNWKHRLLTVAKYANVGWHWL